MKRVRIIIAALVSGLLIAAALHKREPRYQGITLSEWTEKAQTAYANCPDKDHPETDPDWRNCQVAVKTMGTRALPFLLKWIQAEDSAPKMKVIRWLRRKSWTERLDLMPDPALRKHLFSTHGFSLLGSDAQTAFLALIEMTKSKDRDRRFWGFAGFACAKPDKETFIPVASRLLNDTDAEIKDMAATSFYSLYPQEAKGMGLCESFPELCNPPTNVVHTHEMRR